MELRPALLVALLSASCGAPDNEALVFSIEQALATSPDGADLGTVIEGEWDRVCIFRPGVPGTTVDSVVGKPWEDARAPDMDERAAATLLAFVRGSEVIEHVLYPRTKGDFGTIGPEQWYCRPRADAVFQLRHPIDGSIPWIGPVRP